MHVHNVSETDDGFRIEPAGDVGVVRHNFVPPVPEGTYVALVFQVTGYNRDADGSALPELTHVDLGGKKSGWVESQVGLGMKILVVDDLNELRHLPQE